LRGAAIILVLAIAAVAAWEWTSPERTVGKLRDAAAAGDTAALNDVVAFDSVRDNLKLDTRDQLERIVGADAGAIASLGVIFGDAQVGEAIDALVSPAGVAMLTRGRVDPDADLAIDRTGLNTFVVELDRGDGATTPLEFRRHGFGWQLVRIRVESWPGM